MKFLATLSLAALSLATSSLAASTGDHVSNRAPAPLNLLSRVSGLRAKYPKQQPVSQADASRTVQSTAAGAVGCGTNCNSTLTFAGSAAAQFAVGNNIPGIPFATKNSWAGNLPIGAANPNASLYYWLWGAEDAADSDNLIIWLNGGPGCSSLNGFLQENGPIVYINEGDTPAPNPYSWLNAGNVVWLEQPVGTGFTTGKSTVQNEDDVGKQVAGFLDNFYATFPELKGKKLYLTGESYAGSYSKRMYSLKLCNRD